MSDATDAVRLKKAKQVHELLQEYGIENLNELLSLNRRELEYQFRDEDPVTLQRIRDAISYAKTRPEWLTREWHHTWSGSFLGAGVLLSWILGAYGVSLIWVLLLAGIIVEGSRRLKDAYFQQVTLSARRQASRMRAIHFGESAEWFNLLLQDCWSLGARAYFEDLIQESVNDVFDLYKLPGMQSLAIAELELGDEGLTISKIHHFPAENEKERTVDVVLSYSSSTARAVIKAKVVGITAACTLSKVEMHAHARLFITLNKDLPMPFVDSVQLSLLSSPKVDFGLLPVGSFDILKVFPVFDRWVKGVLVACLDELFLEPERFEVYCGDPNPDEEVQGSNGLKRGVLLVDVVRGRDLHPTSSRRKRKGGAQFSVCVQTLMQRCETPPTLGPNPSWNHQFGLLIASSTADKISIDVFDRGLGLKPTLVGRARFRMSELVSDPVGYGKTLEFTLDMIDRVGSVDVRFRFVRLPRLPSRFLPPHIAITRARRQRDTANRSAAAEERKASTASLSTAVAGARDKVKRTAAAAAKGATAAVVEGARLVVPKKGQQHQPDSERQRRKQTGVPPQTTQPLRSRASDAAVGHGASPSVPADVTSGSTSTSGPEAHGLTARASSASLASACSDRKSTLSTGAAQASAQGTGATPNPDELALQAEEDAARLAALENQECTSTTGVLFVRVHEAVDLYPADRAKLSDPFCVVKCNGSKVLSTPTIFKTLNPKWDIEVPRKAKYTVFREFLVSDVTSTRLEFRVYDHDTFSLNDFIGATCVRLDSLMSQHRNVLIDKWLPLSNRKVPTVVPLDMDLSGTTKRGRIHISVIFRPIPVDESVFDADCCLGSVRGKRPSKKLDTKRTKSARHRQDPGGGPVKGPEHYPQGGLLRVQICEGRKLLPKDVSVFGKRSSDPYVVARLGQFHLYKTKTVNKSLKPIWQGESFSATVIDASKEPLSFCVYDYDRLSRDDFMGSVILALTPEMDGTPKWYDLGPENNGQLKLKISFTSSSALKAEGRRVSSSSSLTASKAVQGHTPLLNSMAAVDFNTSSGSESRRRAGLQPAYGGDGGSLQEDLGDDEDDVVDEGVRGAAAFNVSEDEGSDRFPSPGQRGSGIATSALLSASPSVDDPLWFEGPDRVAASSPLQSPVDSYGLRQRRSGSASESTLPPRPRRRSASVGSSANSSPAAATSPEVSAAPRSKARNFFRIGRNRGRKDSRRDTASLEFRQRTRNTQEPTMDVEGVLVAVQNLGGTHASAKVSAWMGDASAPLCKAPEMIIDKGCARWRAAAFCLQNAQLTDSLNIQFFSRTSRLRKALAASGTFTLEDLLGSTAEEALASGHGETVSMLSLQAHRAALDGASDITAEFKLRVTAVNASV